jgi:hypothetical protein
LSASDTYYVALAEACISRHSKSAVTEGNGSLPWRVPS